MHVLILGTGLAGLAAAQRLLDHPCRVTLIEKQAIPGGRVFSFSAGRDLSWMDNGPHVLMKCNPSLRQFLRCLYAKDVFNETSLLRPVNNILFAEAGKTWELKLGDSLRDLFLIKSFPWSWKEKIYFMQALHKLRQNPGLSDRIKQQSVMQVLKRWNQTSAHFRYFWDPLCLAVMNASPETADAQVLMQTLSAMLQDKEKMTLLVPQRPLHHLLVQAALEHSLEKGAAIFHNQIITGFRIAGDRIKSVELKNGRILRADAFISTLPPWDLVRIGDEKNKPIFPDIMDFSFSPILTAYFRCDALVREYQGTYPAIVCIGNMIQWLFIREDGIIGAVISAAHSWIHQSTEELAYSIREDCKNIFGKTLGGECKVVRIIKMRRATPLLSPEKANLRPGVKTRFRNLFLAGDWTATGLPCTMESAVLSGYRAADAVWQNHENPLSENVCTE